MELMSFSDDAATISVKFQLFSVADVVIETQFEILKEFFSSRPRFDSSKTKIKKPAS